MPALPGDRATRWFQQAAALGGFVATFMAVERRWRSLPARIPVHFNAAGHPNGFGSRDFSWILVGAAAFTYVLLTLVGRLPRLYNLPVAPGSPQRAAFEQIGADMVGWLNVAIAWIFFWVARGMMRAAMGHGGGLGPLFSFVVPLVIFGLLGRFFLQARHIDRERPGQGTGP